MSLRNLVFPIATVVGLLAATPAAADPITFDNTDIGVDYTIDFNGFSGDSSNVVDGLGAQLILTLTSIVDGVYSFAYSMTNTSGAPVTQSDVTSFSFNTDPSLVGAESTGYYGNAVLNGGYPNGIGTVDVCFEADGNNSCQGGIANLFIGDTGTGTLTLDFGGALSSLTLSDFYVRYQQVAGVDGVGSASGEQTSSSGGGSSSGGTDIPEPSMVLLFGLAAAMIFAGTRRRRSEDSEEALSIA